jgi:hypothetical protein
MIVAMPGKQQCRNLQNKSTDMAKIVLVIVALTAAAFLPFKPIPKAKGFAVIELFTSEGCSSCPPADALVAAVQKENKDQPVYILAYHVDYWDRLGWKDAFSDAAYSDRQKDYARWLRLQSIYTPEVVVNGHTEFVGSDARALHSAIATSLQESPNASLTITTTPTSGTGIKWQASASTTATNKNLRLVIAVVAHNASTQVKAGENDGKTLAHVQIVRHLTTTKLDTKGNAEGQLTWPGDLRSTDGEIIAFLQNIDTGRIIAATKTK